LFIKTSIKNAKSTVSRTGECKVSADRRPIC